MAAIKHFPSISLGCDRYHFLLHRVTFFFLFLLWKANRLIYSNVWQWQVVFSWFPLRASHLLWKLDGKMLSKRLVQPAIEESWSIKPSIAAKHRHTSIICVSPYDRIYSMRTCFGLNAVAESVDVQCTQVFFFCFLFCRTGTMIENIHQAHRILCHCNVCICRSKGILNVCSCQPSAYLIKKYRVFLLLLQFICVFHLFWKKE